MLRSRLRRPTLPLPAAALAGLLAAALLAGPPAGAYRARAGLTSVNEWGGLTMQGSKGTTVAEKGVCWGTFNCAVIMQMTLSGVHVSASFTAWLSGGSISGAATARILRATPSAAYFDGTLSLHGGTRGRSGASGTARFQGTINRKTYALSMHVSGRLRL